MNQGKNVLVFVVVLVLILVGYFVLYKKTPIIPNREFSKEIPVGATEFRGRLVKVDGNKITLNGSFFASASPRALVGQVKDFSFIVNESTTWKKLEMALPSYSSLRESGTTTRTFEIKDLPRKDGVGSIDDLGSSMSKGAVIVKIDFSFSVGSSKNPVATSVFYQIIVNPSDS